MSYDEYFIEGDKPFAENLNDSILISNVMNFLVTVNAPTDFSNNRFMDETSRRKCGVSILRFRENLPTGVSINTNGEIVFSSAKTIDLFVYPNFNLFGSWNKIKWVSTSNKIKIDLLTKDGSTIRTNIGNNTQLSSDVELQKLDEIIVRIKASASDTLKSISFVFAKKSADVSAITFPNYSTTDEMNTAINNAVSSKAESSTLTNHTNNSTIHVTSTEKTNWNNKANASHTHSIANVTNLSTSLDNKANVSETGKTLAVSGKSVSLKDKNGNTLSTITTQDTTYNVASTTANGLMSSGDKTKLNGVATGANKTVVDTTLKADSTNPVQNSVINDALAGKANSSHTHTIDNVTNLQSTLNGKQATLNSGVNIKTVNGNSLVGAGNVNIEIPTPITDYTQLTNIPSINGNALTGNKTSAGLGLAAASHAHTIANITNLQTTLDGKAPTSHTHTIANVTNLQTTLNGKANASHTHTKDQITDFPSTVQMKFTFTDGTSQTLNVYVG